MYVNKKITLDDDNTYIVIEEVNVDNNTYLCLVNSTNDEDITFVEIKDNKAVPIEDELFDKKIFPLFMEKFNA